MQACSQIEKGTNFKMARTLTNDIIDAAIDGFEAQKRRIDEQIAELKSIREGAPSPDGPSAAVKKGGRQFSPATLRRMREGQQRRWAKTRGEVEPAPAAPVAKKRRMSAAGRKAIQDAVRRRWAQKRAEAGTANPAANTVTKKSAGGARQTTGKRAPKSKRH